MTTFAWYINLAAAATFVIGLHLMNSPRTARRGNALSAVAMGVAILMAAVESGVNGFASAGALVALVLGLAAGAVLGAVSAGKVRMTAMPQLVSVFNMVGGGAAALVAVYDAGSGTAVPVAVRVTAFLGILIGGLTFSGSLVAAGKLQGVIPGKPFHIPAGKLVDVLLAILAIVGAVGLVAGAPVWPVPALVVAALAFGLTLVLPIGGADMPVVISLLNACTGTAVAMAGFVIGNLLLIVAGALVGAAGAILSALMARAMNRSIPAIVAGGFGSGTAAATSTDEQKPARTTDADDVAIQLAYAHKVMIVPGFGLAAARAQHELADLGKLLESRGVDVSYAIHPVAGRMPGHMNVLLAEANVPYDQLVDMDTANPQFPQADVVLVVGANDVTNPAARVPGSPIAGMPILDVDKARSVVVIKRSMGHGYAGIDNPLYTNPKTAMLFGDAKAALGAILSATKTLVA